MAVSIQILEKVISGGRTIDKTQTFNGDARETRSVAVADAQTDYLIQFSLDVSQIQGIYIVSDQDVTLETNNGTTPDETLALLANQPYVWYTGSYLTNVLVTDITALYITNASGSVANIDIEVVFDSTP